MKDPKKVMRSVEYTRSDLVENLQDKARLAHSALMNLLTGTANTSNKSDWAAIYSIASMLKAALDNLLQDGEKQGPE